MKFDSLLASCVTSYHEDPPAPPAPPAPGGTKTFTQEELNGILAKEKTKFTQEKTALATQLEQIRNSSALTAQEKEQLQAKIEELQTAHLTVEEKARREADKLKKDYEGKVEMTTKERDTWRSRFETTTTDNAILGAAATEKAYNPNQLISLLKPMTKLVEQTGDDGQPNGSFVPRVKFPTKDQKGKEVILDLTVSEAVKAMKDMDEYANLFISSANGGLGAQNNGQRKSSKPATQMSPSEYMEARKKDQNLKFTQQP